MILTKENIGTIDIESVVDEYIRTGKVNELLILVPTNRKLRHLKKEIIARVPNKTVSTINIETLTTFSSKLLACERNYNQLSEAAAYVLIRQSAGEVDMKYFTNYKGEFPFGTLERIKNVISEYKKHNILPETVAKEAEELNPTERLKANDIANIYKTYLGKCASLNAYEVGDVYRELLELPLHNFESAFASVYPDVNLVFADGFDEFTMPEIDMLNQTASIENIKLYLNFDYYKYNPLIFSHLDRNYEKLEAKGFKRVEDKSPERNTKFLQQVRQNLFLGKTDKQQTVHGKEIKNITAATKEEEIELTAKEIKRLITEEKCKPHVICVSFNLIQEYSGVVRDMFKRYGIPLNLTDRLRLDNSLPVIAVVSFLEVLENNYYYKNIFRALNNAMIEIKGIDENNLLRVASELKIVIGKDTWINRIDDAIRNLNFSEEEQYAREDQEHEYRKALNDIKQLQEMLKRFEAKYTPSGFMDVLKDFIFELGLHEKILAAPYANKEENVKGLTAFIEICEEIFNLLEEEHGSEAEFDIDFYLSQIRTACRWARFNVKEKSDYGVLATTINEIRGLRFDYLFISGMNDGSFPTRYSPEIFFSGSFMKKEMIHQNEERYHYYQTLCCWNKGLYLTRPMHSNKKELVESTFINETAQLFEIEKKDGSDYKNKLFSVDELLANLTKEKLAEYDEIDADNIGKSISVDEIRSTDPYAETPYTGYLKGSGLSEESVNRLEQFKDREYSISQLETYAKCPFKFYMERILKIESIEEPTEDVEAFEMGNLLHGILFEFFPALRNDGILLTGCDDETFRKAENMLYDIAEKKFDELIFDSVNTFHEREKIFGLSGNRKDSILYKVLLRERERDDDFVPEYFEVSFGKVNKDETDTILSSDEPVTAGNVKLRGKIDRVETNPGGSINIVDYKLSGAKPAMKDLFNGLSLQLPVYMYTAQKLLNDHFGKEFTPNQMVIYSLKYNENQFGWSPVSLTRKKKDVDYEMLNNEVMEAAINYMNSYVESISEGKFPLSQLPDRDTKVCGYCTFNKVCRVQETSKPN